MKQLALWGSFICVLPFTRAIQVDAATFARMSFDYIIVGGGTTGLGVAARLSDDPSITVGVIEAGKNFEDNTVLIPALAGSGVGNSKYDWLLSTSPQSELNNRTCGLGRGKILGGTSAMNSMQYTKASKREYDDWGTLGNPGWNFSDLQGFMKQAERWTPPEPQTVGLYATDNHAPDHGREGSIHTTAYANFSDLTSQYLTSLENLSGVQRNLAPLGGNTIGSMSVTVTVDAQNRSRSFSHNGYYHPRSFRSNLVVLTSAEVTKLRVIKQNQALKATHVNYITDTNQTFSVPVRTEVIISAGTVKTPQVLEQSGIGDRSVLSKLGIDVLLDLPGVGNNLQDHVAVRVTFETFKNVTTLDAIHDPSVLPTLFEEYDTNRTGILSSGSATTAFIPLNKFMSAGEIAGLKSDLDRDLSQISGPLKKPYDVQRAWLEDETVPQIEMGFVAANRAPETDSDLTARFWTGAVVLSHPFSRGSVHIADKTPRSVPVINPEFLKSPGDFDRKVLVYGLRHVMALAQTEPIRSFTISVVSGPPFNATDEQLDGWVRGNGTSNLHPTGSAAMLPQALNGVIGPDFLVHGTTNIRVADMSVWPLQLTPHPTATLYGIAEKVASIIKRTRELSRASVRMVSDTKDPQFDS